MSQVAMPEAFVIPVQVCALPPLPSVKVTVRPAIGTIPS